MSQREAGQWWFRGILRRFVVGRTHRGIVVEAGVCDEHGLGYVNDDDWDQWHHEPRCTGWDWVVPEPQPEDPDEWVIQDRVPIRVKIDRCWYMDGECGLPADLEDMWQKYNKDHFLDGKKHGDYVRDGGGSLHVMCRRRDLPKVEQAEQCAACDAPAEPGTAGCKDCNEYATAICSPEPEQWPKYWTTCDATEFAYVEQTSDLDAKFVRKDGSYVIAKWGMEELRKRLTEDEAMALIKKPQPQPQKTRVRLWATRDGIVWMSGNACPLRSWQEIHHDSEGFYVE